MADRDPQPAAPAPPADETLPQWKPPASATRSVASGLHGGDATISGYDRTLAADGRSSSARPLAVGDIIGERYVIEEPISSGGFGGVYRASDRQIRNHQVALKLAHKPAADEQARADALRELTLIASVSHPSIVQFKDYGWHEGRLWFAMPWYRGETLDRRYRDRDDEHKLGSISRAEARPIFVQLAQGLAAMHQVGIHHHDIKPENIFLAEIAGFGTGLPVLLDLGIATQPGEGPKGLTVEYTSPETAAAVLGNREQPIGAAADVFSLALVLRNLLEPETAPKVEGEIMPLLHKRASEPIAPFARRELRYLRPAFARWLNLDPGKRPSAAEFAAELALLTAPEEQREGRARLLRRLVPLLLAVAALVAVLVWQLRKQKTELTQERAKLSEQSRENEELRKRTTEQLQQLEAESQRSGTPDQRLARATANAHQFKQLLDKAEDRIESLNKKLRKLTEERDALGSERDGLRGERDNLTRERDGLRGERDNLSRERDQLLVARDGLTRERDALARARDGLEQERNTVLAQRNEAIRDRTRLEGELEQGKRELAAAEAERDALRKQQAELEAKLRELSAERDRLEAVRSAGGPRVRGRLPAPKPSPEPPPAAPDSEGHVQMQ